MKTGIKVIDIMLRKPISVGPDTTLKECAVLMKKRKVDSCIIEEKNNVLGIITEKDFVRDVIAEGIDTEKITVKEAMTKDIITIEPGKDIFDAIIKMKDHNVRQMPVTDGKKMVGLLTQKNVLRIEPHLFDLLIEKIEQKERRISPANMIVETEGICEECGRYTPHIIQKEGSMLCENCSDRP